MAALTSKDVNINAIDKNELQKYRAILEMTEAHLEGYKFGGNIKMSRGSKYRDVISKLFPQTKRQQWKSY